MAQRRMFSLKIVDTDAFLDMPQSSQLLYFHLAMRGDDEGFVGNPKKIMRAVGANEDDMKVLLAKRFLLTFNSGVVVIKHWLIHNTIRMDRFSPTTYKEEKGMLFIKENGAYTDNNNDGGNLLATSWQPKLSKVKLSKDKKRKENTSSFKKKPYYRGNPMRESPVGSGKWFVIDDGQWLEFAGQKEEIEYK